MRHCRKQCWWAFEDKDEFTAFFVEWIDCLARLTTMNRYRLAFLFAFLEISILGLSGSMNAQETAPQIIGLSPDSKTAGEAEFKLTVWGNAVFPANCAVYWNGVLRTTTVFSPTVLEAKILASDIALEGTAEVTVHTSGGAVSNVLTFTIMTTNPNPVISGISPSSIVAGSSDFTLTVTGQSFIAQSVILWNGVARTTTFVDSGTLTAVIPAADVAQIGTASVSVWNNAPGGTTSSSLPLTIAQYASVLYFPQFAIGGGYTTNLSLLNVSNEATNVMMTFTNPRGDPLTVNGVLSTGGIVGTNYVLYISIPAHGVRDITLTDPAGGTTVSSGWIKVESNGRLEGIATYRYAPYGAPTALVGVLPANVSSSVRIPINNSWNLAREAAFAIANTGASTINVTLYFYDAEGYRVRTVDLDPLPAKRQISNYFWQLFEGSKDLEGSVVISSPDGQFAAISVGYDQNLVTATPVITGSN
jgi:hypothetical protein